MNGELLSKVRDTITGTRFAGGAILRRMVVSAGTVVIKTNCPEKMRFFGGSLELTGGWARNVLKSMQWSKRKRTNGKIEPSEQFIREEMLNSLSANPTKWSNKLKKFVGNLPTNCLSVFDHFV